MNKNRKKNRETESTAEAKLKGFLDMIAPSVIQFYTDHYICGNTYRSVWALREYPTATDEQAILRHLGEKDGVTLRIYTRQVTPAEEKKIISNAANKNRMKQGNTENLQETVTAASNLQDVTTIISTMHRNREPLLHTAVFLELSAPDMEKPETAADGGVDRINPLQVKCGQAPAAPEAGLSVCPPGRKKCVP